MFVLPAARRRARHLGVTNGRLTNCVNKPNCVSTQAPAGPHYVAPLSYSGSREDALQALHALIGADPKATLVTETADYLHVEYQAFVFIDDVEFYLPPDDSVVHLRSASRLGHFDLGANRRRYQAIAKAFSSRL